MGAGGVVWWTLRYLGCMGLGSFARERVGMSLTLRLRRDDFAFAEALVALMAAYSICRRAVLRVGKIAP